jgi:hypothetical protein
MLLNYKNTLRYKKQWRNWIFLAAIVSKCSPRQWGNIFCKVNLHFRQPNFGCYPKLRFENILLPGF